MELFEPVFLNANQFSVVGPTSLSEEEAAGFLRSYCALWHPRILANAVSLPRISAEIGSEPGIAKPIALVGDPATAERVRATFFESGRDPEFLIQAHLPDFQEKYQALLCRLEAAGLEDREGRPEGGEFSQRERRIQAGAEEWAAFRGLGLGLAWVDALFETQNHTNLVDREGFLAACQNAAKAWLDGDQEQTDSRLREAADILAQARTQVVGGTPRIIESVDWDENRENDCPALPKSVHFGLKGAVFACGETLLSLSNRNPEVLAQVKERASDLEVCGGRYFQRKDSLRPLASQLWNLREGQKVHKSLLGDYCKVVVHFANDLHPVLPAIWRQNAISHGVLKGDFAEGNGGYRGSYTGRSRVSIVSWSCGDGLGIETLVRQTQDSDSALTGLDLAYHFQQSQSSDYCPILHFKSPSQTQSGWYLDFLELCRLAPVMGEHGLPSEVLRAASPGDYWSSSTADELMPDPKGKDDLKTYPNREWRKSRQEIQAQWAFISLLASLQGGGKEGEEGPPWVKLADALSIKELAWERNEGPAPSLSVGDEGAASELAKWIVSRGPANTPGWVLLNPCGFMRRGIVHWPEPVSLPVEGPIKASQIEPDGTTSAVVEVPPFGFCWVPRKPHSVVSARPNRIRLADERGVRNEFLEADIDQATGDVRTIRDTRNRKQKVSIQVFGGAGNVMVGKQIRVLSPGPARGEIESLGELVHANGEKVGEFQIRLRAWLGRPLLEIFAKVELGSKSLGDPFLRVSWRDPSMDLRRGWLGQAFRLREEIQLAGDWVEIAEGSSSTTTLVPMDFPFCKRQGKRALDFPMGKGNPAMGEDHALGIALDRDFPFLLAQGTDAPLPAIAVNNGPPPSGPNGWLAMLDHAEMLVADVRPRKNADENWLNWQMLSSSQEGFELGFSMAKGPAEATVMDALGQEVRSLDLDANEMRVFVQRMEWLGIGTKMR